MSVRTIVEHGCPLTVQTLERVDALGATYWQRAAVLDDRAHTHAATLPPSRSWRLRLPSQECGPPAGGGPPGIR